jgi:hypothetical protein
MTLQEQQRQQQSEGIRRAGGIGLSGASILAYSADREREIQEKPSFTRYRVALQNADGEFLKKPNDDGTLSSGTFGIDAFGRFVSV